MLSIDSLYASQKPNIELQKVLSFPRRLPKNMWNILPENVVAIEWHCFKENTIVRQTLLIILFCQQILAHVFYRGIMEFIITEGQKSCH